MAPSTAPAIALPPEPRRFGRYILLGTIGSGGMAEAHLALLVSEGGAERLVVVKTLLPDLAEEPASLTMFLDEARALSALSHPSLLQIHDSGFQDGAPFIVVEYLDGLTLSELALGCHERGVLPPVSVVVRVIAEIAAGLAHANAARTLDGTPLELVHRDVSPSNVMVLRNGTAKLIDFGVAKTTRNLTTTEIGSVKGKPRFVAPELISGERPTAAADVWALGVLLWETLTQRRLFRGRGFIEVMTRVKTEPIAPPSAHAPRVDRTLDGIVASALDRDPSTRCSMEAFHQALTRWLSARTPHVGAGDVAAFLRDVGRSQLAERDALIRDWLQRVEDARPLRELPSERTTLTEHTTSTERRAHRADTARKDVPMKSAPPPARPHVPPPLPRRAAPHTSARPPAPPHVATPLAAKKPSAPPPPGATPLAAKPSTRPHAAMLPTPRATKKPSTPSVVAKPSTPPPLSAKPSSPPRAAKPSTPPLAANLVAAKPSTPPLPTKPSTPPHAAKPVAARPSTPPLPTKPSTPVAAKPSTPPVAAKPSTPRAAKPSTPPTAKPSTPRAAKPSTPPTAKLSTPPPAAKPSSPPTAKLSTPPLAAKPSTPPLATAAKLSTPPAAPASATPSTPPRPTASTTSPPPLEPRPTTAAVAARPTTRPGSIPPPSVPSRLPPPVPAPPASVLRLPAPPRAPTLDARPTINAEPEEQAPSVALDDLDLDEGAAFGRDLWIPRFASLAQRIRPLAHPYRATAVGVAAATFLSIMALGDAAPDAHAKTPRPIAALAAPASAPRSVADATPVLARRDALRGADGEAPSFEPQAADPARVEPLAAEAQPEVAHEA
ncbi:MAG: protein kinase, partial [Myxococcales bacterium]|nr:protein kinase [Myxococcales bacterium]